MQSPSGGPVDDTKPTVVSTVPDSGAIRVAAIDSISLVFSERMNHRSVEESFTMTPEVSYAGRSWVETEGQVAWILELREPLQDDRTYVGFLGAAAADRRKNTLGAPWSFVFSTGDRIDPGAITGQVVGQRFPPKNQFLYIYPWESAPPDTTEESYPRPPERLGQTDETGAFALRYLPVDLPLRLCVFFDREKDGVFDPGIDRWVCRAEAITLSDSALVREDLEIYIADPDEPGTLAGTAVDSSCVRSDYRKVLNRVRASRDSLEQWMEGERSSSARGYTGLSAADSLRIGAELAALAREEGRARDDSLYCTQPILVTVETTGGEVLREHSGAAAFRWTDIPTGVYRIRGFRDVDMDGSLDPGEPRGAFPYAVDVQPLRVLDGLDFELIVPEGTDASSTPGSEPAPDVPSETAPPRPNPQEGSP